MLDLQVGCPPPLRGSSHEERQRFASSAMITPVRADLPAGTVTLLFTDIEGSTALLGTLGAERYAEALAEHRLLVRQVASASGGVEVDTQGDAFFLVFATPTDALTAAEG